MNINNLYFHVHYCNLRQSKGDIIKPIHISRKLQHHELVLVIQGKGSFIIHDKKHELKDGMLLYISPDTLHTLYINPHSPVHCLTVHFSYVRINFQDGGWDLQKESRNFHLPHIQQLKDYYQIEDSFSKLCQSWETKQPGYEFLTRTYLQQLFISIHQNMKKDTHNFALSIKVDKIIAYMNEHLSSKIVLSELAELVQLSPAYLSRTFKELTGYSVIEFFNKLKIDKAKEILMEGNPKIKEVADALGYTDEFYFSRLFKKIEGLSPSEFWSKNVHGN